MQSNYPYQKILDTPLSFQERARNSLSSITAGFLFLLAAFPYISPVNLGFDTQPYCLLFAFLLTFVRITGSRSVTLTREVFALFLLLLVASILFIAGTNKSVGARSMAGYMTILFVTYAAYHHSYKLKIKWFNFSVYLWFAFGVIQTGYDKLFGSFLLPRMSTTETRGITSLAVEPSYAATICVFLLLMNDLFMNLNKQSKRKHLFISLLLILLTVLTLSGMGFLFLFVYFLSKIIAIVVSQGISKHLGKIFAIVVILTTVFISFRTIDKLEYSRAGFLLNIAVQDPKYLMISDASLADRLTNVILPVYSLPYSNFVGLGLGTWADNFLALRSYAGGFTEVMAQFSNPDSTRIMSGWGTAIYELGIFGFGYLFIFLRIVRKGAKKRGKLSHLYISIGVTLTFLMALAVPLAFPLFSYLMGMCMYYNNYTVDGEPYHEKAI